MTACVVCASQRIAIHHRRSQTRRLPAGAAGVPSPSGGRTGGGRSAPLASGPAPARPSPPRGSGGDSTLPSHPGGGPTGDTAAVLAPGRPQPERSGRRGNGREEQEGERERQALTCAQGGEQHGGGQQPHGGAAAAARPGATAVQAAPQRAGGGGGEGGDARPLIGCRPLRGRALRPHGELRSALTERSAPPPPSPPVLCSKPGSCAAIRLVFWRCLVAF